jgi:hypothetical protein
MGMSFCISIWESSYILDWKSEKQRERGHMGDLGLNRRIILKLILRCKILPTSCCQASLHKHRKLLGIISVGFDITDQLLLRLSNISEKMGRQ